MKWGAIARRLGALLVAVAAGACSADEGPTPEPQPTTPGVFLSVENADGSLTIIRVLKVFVTDRETILVIKTYEPAARDLEEARRLARQRDLQLADDFNLVALEALASVEVLWFRTLTEEEEHAL